jgi:hypothetical protein
VIFSALCGEDFSPERMIAELPYARSFYIRFAKITLPGTLRLSSRPQQGYNVFRYQALSASTCGPGLASDL